MNDSNAYIKIIRVGQEVKNTLCFYSRVRIIIMTAGEIQQCNAASGIKQPNQLIPPGSF